MKKRKNLTYDEKFEIFELVGYDIWEIRDWAECVRLAEELSEHLVFVGGADGAEEVKIKSKNILRLSQDIRSIADDALGKMG